MSDNKLLEEVRIKAQKWLDGSFDAETKARVKEMMENDEANLIESFYKDLEFGTGGLRGIMGVGTNRMNIYTVGMATQGLCNYLKKEFASLDQIKVAIAHDCRNNSRLFAETAANIFSANNIKVYLFDELRPTPELSFAIRELGCQSGVVLTASHNPKEYNGFKAYWDDGSQLVSPHDVNVVEEAAKVNVDDILFEGKKERIEIIGKELDEKYLARVKKLSLNPEAIERQKDIKIVYTPIHGTGVRLVPEALKNLGFTKVYNVPEQDVVSGDFPTVISPNPEEPAALDMALQKARSVDADIVMASDPDADRVGIAVKNDKGEFVLVNGNQTAVLLSYYLVSQWKQRGKLTGNEYIVKTVVTTDLINKIADSFGVEYFETLTGFKFIADVIRQNEDRRTYIGGGEESYGFLAGDFVRDKDAVTACSLLAEITAWAKDQGKSVFDLIQDIYLEFGMFRERLLSIVRKGKSGAEEIAQMMEQFRSNPPESIDGARIIKVNDFLKRTSIDTITGHVSEIDLPKSNVLQFFTEDGSKISMRPSGTEPKIKFYFSVQDELPSRDEYYQIEAKLEARIDRIMKELSLK